MSDAFGLKIRAILKKGLRLNSLYKAEEPIQHLLELGADIVSKWNVFNAAERDHHVRNQEGVVVLASKPLDEV